MADQDQALLSRLPRCPEWVAGIISSPSYVFDEGEPYRPAAVLWVETGSGLIVGCELVHPREALERAAGLFMESARAPLAGKPRVPERVRVAEPELCAALKGRVGGVPLVQSETPELDTVAESFISHMMEAGDEEEEDESLLVPGTSPQDMAHMFRAAARFYRLQPWQVFPPDTFASVSCEALGIEKGALCVVGQMGESYGFVLFHSIADAVAYSDAVDVIEAGGQPAFPRHVMFGFEERSAVGNVLVREIRSHSWELAGPHAYPAAVLVDPDLVTRPLGRGEMLAVTAIIEATADLVEAEPDLADAWAGGPPRRREASVPTAVGAIAVALEVPAWLPGDEKRRAVKEEVADDVDLESLLDAGFDDEEQCELYCQAMMDRFARSPEGSGEHLEWAEMVVEHVADHHGLAITALTPRLVREILFETIPRQVSVGPDDAPAVVAALRALLAFAAREFRSARARKALGSLAADAPQQVARALRDPRKFGPAKAMVMAGARAGYDMTSEEGLAAWMKVAHTEMREQRPAHHGGRRDAASSEASRRRTAANKARRKAARVARRNSRRH